MTKRVVVLLVIALFLAGCSAPKLPQRVATIATSRLVRGVYAMNSFSTVPLGAMGATIFASWAELNPARNVYTWGSLDYQIEQHAQAGRPVRLMVTVSRSGYYPPSFLYVDDSPAWIAKTHLVPIADKTMRLPAYDNAEWKAALWSFVAALGAHYDKDMRLTALTIGLGLDAETHAYKSDYEAAVVTALGTGYRASFERYCKEAIVYHHNAFPTLPLFVACNPGGQAFRRDLLKNYMVRFGIGILDAGLDVDNPTAWGPATYLDQGGNYALHAPQRDLHGILPVWFESVTGVVTPESAYWSLLFAISQNPDAIDLHKEWFSANPSAVAWARAYLKDPNRGVWIAFRDAEYGPAIPSIPDTSNMFLSGWPNDFSHGITRETAAPRLLRWDLPVQCQGQQESRQARVFTGTSILHVTDPAALGTRVTMRTCYLDGANNFSLAFVSANGESSSGIQYTGQGTNRFVWVEYTIVLPDGWDGAIEIGGSCVLHMIELVKESLPTPTVTTGTATWTPTETLRPTLTATSTSTPTHTPTETPTSTPASSTSARRFVMVDVAGHVMGEGTLFPGEPDRVAVVWLLNYRSVELYDSMDDLVNAHYELDLEWVDEGGVG